MQLTIRHLSKRYPNGVHALDDVSLTIPRGLFGLLGPNGAGKSSLMRTISTLQDPDRGSIAFEFDADGQSETIDVVGRKDRVRATLGYLPQEFGVYPHSTAERLLDHFAMLKGLVDRHRRREAVESLLVQTNLHTVRTRKLGTFSGGMRQRFGVAVALLNNPRLLVVDEPTAGLDPIERVRFLNLLSELGEDAVVLLSTHIVDDVRDLCGRMAIIQHGRILFEGEPEQAIDTMRGRIWQRVVTRSERAGVERAHAIISTRLAAGRTALRAHSMTDPGDRFEPVDPDLEDVYFATMAGHGPDAPHFAPGGAGR